MSIAGLSLVSPSPQPTSRAPIAATLSAAPLFTSAETHANGPRFGAMRQAERALDGVVIDILSFYDECSP
jgi:hypothetical protein